MSTARARLVPLAAAALVLALAACTPAPSPSPTGSHSGHTPRPSHTPSATAVPTPTASVVGTPVTKSCVQLIPAGTMYAFNPNFVAVSTWTPSAGTAAAQAVANKGVACRWQNETSDDVIDLSVADLDHATIESLKNQAVDKSTLVPTYEGADEGYFSAADGTGTAIVFLKGYWIVLTSQQFAEPGDPADLVASVLAALR